MNDFRGLYDIRDATPTDKAFILATFLRGVYHGESTEAKHGRRFFSLIPKDLFMDNYKLVAESLITNPTTLVKVACLKEDPDVILGYSVLSADFTTIHWCHVKKAWRGKGIARSLLPPTPLYVSHLSDLGRILMNKFNNVTFNPFL